MESEFDLIAAIVERLPAPGEGVRVASGDDAAVVEPRVRATVTSVDSVVEGVHFRLKQFGARAVGRKALAAALSDLAAMGAEPGEAYVALGVPPVVRDEELLELAEGLAEVATREGVSVVGGDVTRAPALSLAVTCVGYEPEGGRLVTRAGAQPGDAVVVTGELGGAAGGLRLLEQGRDRSWRRENLDAAVQALAARQLDPQPRLAEGRTLAAVGATAMIDVSDGIGQDAGHVAKASGVRIEIEAQRLPLARGLVELMGGSKAALPMVLSGGEDYELLATLPAEAAQSLDGPRAGAGVTVIGKVLEGEGAAVIGLDGNEMEAGGFDHMRGSPPGADSSSFSTF